MITINTLILLLAAYLIGSMPFAVWVGQVFYGIDVREYGSGNAGATNTLRVLGKKAGVAVLLLDILKGGVAVLLARIGTNYDLNSEQYVNLELVLGISSLFGHIFPVYAGFRGGKGIATLLGVVIAINPYAAMYVSLVFIVVLILTRYVSLSSMVASIAFPLYIIFIEKSEYMSLITFSLFITVLVIITHQKNIERLLRNEESKIFAKNEQIEDDDEVDD